MSKKNFYDDILKICEHLDKQEGKDFDAWQFKFEVASEVATGNKKGSWRLDDERGGVHYFEFHDRKHLYYKNSIREDKTPPLILEPIEDSEIKQIVDDMIAKFESGSLMSRSPMKSARSYLPCLALLGLKKSDN